MDSDIEVLLYDYDAAARVLSLSRAALRDLVYKGRGPRITKIGRRTLFARKDLETFVDKHRKHSEQCERIKFPGKPRKRGRPSIAEVLAQGEA